MDIMLILLILTIVVWSIHWYVRYRRSEAARRARNLRIIQAGKDPGRSRAPRD